MWNIEGGRGVTTRMHDCFPDHRVRQSYLPVYGHMKVSRSNHEYVNCIIQKTAVNGLI